MTTSLSSLKEQAILAAWRLTQIEINDVIDSDKKQWIDDTIEVLKQLAIKVNK